MRPRDLIAAAASVRGARAYGIETDAARAAPALLERARAEVARLLARAGEIAPSAPDEVAEARYARAVARARALAAAADELAAALAGTD